MNGKRLSRFSKQRIKRQSRIEEMERIFWNCYYGKSGKVLLLSDVISRADLLDFREACLGDRLFCFASDATLRVYERTLNMILEDHDMEGNSR